MYNPEVSVDRSMRVLRCDVVLDGTYVACPPRAAGGASCRTAAARALGWRRGLGYTTNAAKGLRALEGEREVEREVVRLEEINRMANP